MCQAAFKHESGPLSFIRQSCLLSSLGTAAEPIHSCFLGCCTCFCSFFGNESCLPPAGPFNQMFWLTRIHYRIGWCKKKGVRGRSGDRLCHFIYKEKVRPHVTAFACRWTRQHGYLSLSWHECWKMSECLANGLAGELIYWRTFFWLVRLFPPSRVLNSLQLQELRYGWLLLSQSLTGHFIPYHRDKDAQRKTRQPRERIDRNTNQLTYFLGR